MKDNLIDIWLWVVAIAMTVVMVCTAMAWIVGIVELNTLRNFATAVDIRLQKAEKAAKEQDNHHYYKIFTECVKEMLEKL